MGKVALDVELRKCSRGIGLCHGWLCLDLAGFGGTLRRAPSRCEPLHHDFSDRLRPDELCQQLAL